MTNNDLVLLDSVLKKWSENAPAGLSESSLFELFAAEQLLKRHDVSNEDVMSGMVGGGGDGGIDSVYTLVDGDVVDEDSDVSNVKRDPELSLYVVQAKRTPSFAQVVFDRVAASLRNLLELTKTREELGKRYSSDLIDRFMIFRNVLVELANRYPRVKVHFVYATRGSADNIHSTVVAKGDDLVALVKEKLPEASTQVTYWGARELLEESRRTPTYTLQLKYIENPISVSDCHVVLVNLRDYAKFISDDDGQRREYLFESNVRDYQGNVEVNSDISRTLELNAPPDFWWLNNGVTIISSKASITGNKTLVLEDVQIVNGLQTSVRVHEHVAKDPDKTEPRAILCRIIVTNDSETRDRIIKATNFQTAIPPVSLKATDEIQRDIEEFFAGRGWYYDRRKSYHKNLGRPAERIVSIAYLAQAVMALGLSRPADSRGRPTSLIKNDEDYKRVFDPEVAMQTYLWAAETMKSVDAFVRKEALAETAAFKREFRFHLAMLLASRALDSRVYHPAQLSPLTTKKFSETEMADAWQTLRSNVVNYAEFKTRPLDAIAKSPKFVTHVLQTTFGQNIPPVTGPTPA